MVAPQSVVELHVYEGGYFLNRHATKGFWTAVRGFSSEHSPSEVLFVEFLRGIGGACQFFGARYHLILDFYHVVAVTQL